MMTTPWQAVVLTLFPGMFPGPLAFALAGKALTAGHWALSAMDIRAYADDRYGAVDDAPFGGGPGMVMRPDVVDAAIADAVDRFPGLPLVYLTPRGRRLEQADVRELAGGAGVILLCGHYEGIDERVVDAWRPREVSVGDFVLSGGETAAFVLFDACLRLRPGVVGEAESLMDESFENGLLEYPHYTRPRLWAGRDVPEILLSGHHRRIAEWRLAEAERITRERRPDLWQRYVHTRRPMIVASTAQPHDSEGGWR